MHASMDTNCLGLIIQEKTILIKSKKIDTLIIFRKWTCIKDTEQIVHPIIVSQLILRFWKIKVNRIEKLLRDMCCNQHAEYNNIWTRYFSELLYIFASLVRKTSGIFYFLAQAFANLHGKRRQGFVRESVVRESMDQKIKKSGSFSNQKSKNMNYGSPLFPAFRYV